MTNPLHKAKPKKQPMVRERGNSITSNENERQGLVDEKECGGRFRVAVMKKTLMMLAKVVGWWWWFQGEEGKGEGKRDSALRCGFANVSSTSRSRWPYIA